MRAVEHPQLHTLESLDIIRKRYTRFFQCWTMTGNEPVLDHPLTKGLTDHQTRLIPLRDGAYLLPVLRGQAGNNPVHH